jgi:hypothetical protein
MRAQEIRSLAAPTSAATDYQKATIYGKITISILKNTGSPGIVESTWYMLVITIFTLFPHIYYY